MPDRTASRRRKLRSRIRKAGVGALLVTTVNNVRYLTGFSGDSSYLLIGRDCELLISDTRYETQLAEECPGLDVRIRSARQPMNAAVVEAVHTAGVTTLGFESVTTSYADWETLHGELKQTELVPLEGLVEGLREIKDSSEIAEIREAIRQAERGFSVLMASLTQDLTELQAAHELEHAMRRFGARQAAFDPIVAVGANAALPHARPTAQHFSSAPFVLVDWGALTERGYRSDLTRVIPTGKVPPKLKKIQAVVSQAQAAAIAQIRPGVRCCDVDAAARQVIAGAGFAKYFGHGLGHGIGLDIHEGPRLSPIHEAPLKSGMIVTVEPGIYLPGFGGVRLEDDVLVTPDGYEVLTSVPHEFDPRLLD